MFCRSEIEGGETGGEDLAKENEFKLGPPGPPFGIVINGSSLVRHFVICYVSI